MLQYGPFPGVEVEFDLNGKPVTDANAALTTAAAAESAIAGIRTCGATDLIVISHGWNNDKEEARALYTAFFTTMKTLVDSKSVVISAERKFFVLAVLWPSARFVDPSQIPGGAAAVVDTSLEDITDQLTLLRTAFAGDAGSQASIDRALAAVPNLGTDPNAQLEFVRGLNALPSDDPEEHDTITTAVADVVHQAKAPESGFDESEVLKRLGSIGAVNSAPATTADDSGGAASTDDETGGAAGNICANIKAGALSLASIFTYKTMKERAGNVGRTGLAEVLGEIRKTVPAILIHLAGHSFGARLVTSAANTPWIGSDATHQATTLALLQGAFSHFGFAVNYLSLGHNGGFRDVIGKPTLTGNAIITHSVHDKAVGWAYPAASAILGQVADALASVNPFGGMGADGAVSTPEAIFDDLGDVGHQYAPLPAKLIVRNLRGDQYISGHGDIVGTQVVFAFLRNVFA